jgi:hypothetical protein
MRYLVFPTMRLVSLRPSTSRDASSSCRLIFPRRASHRSPAGYLSSPPLHFGATPPPLPLWCHSPIDPDTNAGATLLRRHRRYSTPPPPPMTLCHLAGATLLARWATVASPRGCTAPMRPTPRPPGSVCGLAPFAPLMKLRTPTTPWLGG